MSAESSFPLFIAEAELRDGRWHGLALWMTAENESDDTEGYSIADDRDAAIVQALQDLRRNLAKNPSSGELEGL